MDHIDYLMAGINWEIKRLKAKLGAYAQILSEFDDLEHTFYSLAECLSGNLPLYESELSTDEIQSSAVQFLEILSLYRGADSSRMLHEMQLMGGQKMVLSVKTTNKKITQIIMCGIADGLKRMTVPPQFNPMSDVNTCACTCCNHRPYFWLGE